MLAWLGATLVMLLFMVLIGGVTRLTDSGLSMVEWRPLLGALPPLSEAEWLDVFHKYQQYPEYKIVNQRMNLEEFKFIFFWEYFHRLFGRLIGLVFFFPYLFFFLRKKLNKKWNRRLLAALVLGGSQGLLGWFMVKSGLVDRPDVSHFRLAAHFTLALGIMGYIWWLMLELRRESQPAGAAPLAERGSADKAKRLLGAFCVLLGIQVVFGAFVAGLDAGIGYNTFPKMGKYWMPNVLKTSEFLYMAVNSNVGAQFIHRVLAWALFGFAAYLAVFSFRALPKGPVRTSFLCVSGLVFLQFCLGIATLLTKVEIVMASAHQMSACFLTLAAIKCFYDVIHVNNLDMTKLKTANKTTA